jgi:hypothetical protein
MWKPWARMGRNGFRRVERWAAVACTFGNVSQATSMPLRCSHTRFPRVLGDVTAARECSDLGDVAETPRATPGASELVAHADRHSVGGFSRGFECLGEQCNRATSTCRSMTAEIALRTFASTRSSQIAACGDHAIGR